MPTPPQQSDYLSAQEAIRLLEVRPQTLYAYVSRGWIRKLRQAGRKNGLYLREDVERVRARSQARSGHGAVAASAMHWGEPIIPTAITQITPEGPRYRGRLAVQLARDGVSFEAVAELLWSGFLYEDRSRWPLIPLPAEVRRLIQSTAELRSNDQLFEILAFVTLKLGISRGGVAERVRSGRPADAARQIIQVLVGCFAYLSSHRRFLPMRNGQSIVEGLLRSLDVALTAENREAMEAMLVLFADHELSPGAFAARVAASSGATLHGCIASALCTSSGVQVGRIYAQVEEFLAGAPSKSVLLRRAQYYQDRGSAVPGFMHPFYPKGDPRGRFLLDLAKRRARQSRRLEAIYGFVDDAREKLGIHPRHEIAAVALAIAMGIPPHSAGAVFMLARTAGWVAHVMEQRLSQGLLRPRAKFVEP